jgi:hypothetical protein
MLSLIWPSWKDEMAEGHFEAAAIAANRETKVGSFRFRKKKERM